MPNDESRSGRPSDLDRAPTRLRTKSVSTKNAIEEQHSTSLQFPVVCPQCQGSMSFTELAGFEAYRCNKCHGVYFEYGKIEALLQHSMRLAA